MSVHIGNIIKALVKEKGITVDEFAGKISYTRRNAYKIFDKETLDTGLLIRISEVLGENLFFHYIKDSELEDKFNEKMKVKLSLKVWDEFMAAVKSKEAEVKTKSSPAKNKTSTKAAKKTKK